MPFDSGKFSEGPASLPRRRRVVGQRWLEGLILMLNFDQV